MAKSRSIRSRYGSSGQALVEFALTSPILVFLLVAIIDFGTVLFSYSQASSSVRSALRYAETLGYADGRFPYLECEEMEEIATNAFFLASHDVTITYAKADGSGTFTCGVDSPEDINEALINGDLLHIELTATIDPILPIGHLTLKFEGQRSVVKAIPIKLEVG